MSAEVSATTCHQTVDNQAHEGSGENVNTANISSDNRTNRQQETKEEYKDAEITPEKEQLQEFSDPKNDSSTLSTAFTISFDDENSNSNSNKKLFGIRDSIRKFAPPKPNTIEKPRPSKNESSVPDNSYMSIESAPGGFSKHSSSTFRRNTYNSCRSSSRRSDSSRHSNISESAAFLIDKMLNTNKQGESLSSIYLDSDNKARATEKLSRGQNASMGNSSSPKKQVVAPLSGEVEPDDEIDYCEDRSDNGTYIVGADPESDAARKRIDELFGVVKAAEASLKANAAATIIKQKQKAPLATNHSRPSRAPDKKTVTQQMSRERQEHISRLATGRHSSRSSSSSRQELSSVSGHRPRSATRKQPCNSSCDRTHSRLPTAQRHHRRAASQSSRQSSNRDPSEADDTRSSRSSLHAQDFSDMLAAQENQIPNISNPSMKFNRAFALRRARLGLGEPAKIGGAHNNGLPSESDGQVSLLSSPKRVAVAAAGSVYARYNQNSTVSTTTPQNLSRTDGGRFSLRMRNNIASRLTSGYKASQQHPGTALIDNYLGKIPAGSSKLSTVPKSSSNTMPYPSGDELDAAVLSPSRSHRQTMGRLAAANIPVTATKMQNLLERRDIAPEWEMIDSDNRLNYSLGLDQTETTIYNERYIRTCQSAGRQGSNLAMASGQQHQPPLGALDCLVISAISGLSMKIRSSVCDLMFEHAKRLPKENETRLTVEEILPQLAANSSRPKSPTSIEDIDQSVYFDLAQTLKNLKKIEQMVDVMKMISNQIPASSSSPMENNVENNCNATSKSSSTSLSGLQASGGGDANGGETAVGKVSGAGSNTNSEATSLSPV